MRFQAKMVAWGWAAFILVLSFGTGPTWAEPLKITKPVEVRAGMGTYFPIIHQAKPGESLDVLGRDGEWIKVNTPKGPGFVFSKSLSSPTPAPTAKPGGVLPKLSAKSSGADVTAGIKMEAPPSPGGIRAKNMETLEAVATQVREPAVIQFTKPGPSPKLTVRLFGVEPPKNGEPYYSQALEFSKKMVQGQRASVQVLGQTPEGLVLANVILAGGKNLGTELVRAGWARAGGDGTEGMKPLQALEQEARKAGRGMWSRTSAPPPPGTPGHLKKK